MGLWLGADSEHSLHRGIITSNARTAKPACQNKKPKHHQVHERCGVISVAAGVTRSIGDQINVPSTSRLLGFNLDESRRRP